MSIPLAKWGNLFLSVIILYGCGSAEERKASFVTKAKKFIQEDNFPQARVALRNALRIDPQDPHVYFLAGQVSEKEANWPKAFRQYARGVELDPTHQAAVGRLARFYLAAKDIKELEGLSDSILARDPHDVFGHTLQVCVWFLRGEHSRALTKADSLLEQLPTDSNILLMLAAIFSANRELDKARSVLQLGLKVHPDHVDLLNYLATISIGMKAFDKAEAIYLQLLAKEPRGYAHRDKLAGLYRHLGKPDKVLALLREGVALDPNDERRWKSLVMFADSSQREALLEESLQVLPHSFTLRFLLGAHFEHIQEFQKARKMYEAIVLEAETSEQGIKAEVELAKLDVAEENPRAAQIRLASVLEEYPGHFDALLLKGELNVAQNQSSPAVGTFRIVLRDEPNNRDIQRVLGQAHMLAREFELNQENLEKSVALNSRQLDVFSALARLSARQGHLEKAQQYLESILQVVPTHPEAAWSLFQIKLAQRQWAEGDGMIARFEESVWSGYQVDLAKGILASGLQQWDLAVQAFTGAQQAKLHAMAPLAALIHAYLEQRQPEHARDYLQKLVGSHSGHPFAWGLLGAVFVQLHDRASALSAYRKQMEGNPMWVEPWKDWAMVSWSLGRKREAIDMLNEGLTIHVQSPILLKALASFYQANGQIDLAIRQYELVLNHSPHDVLAANNLAFLLAEEKGDVQSLAYAVDLTRNFEARTQNPFLLDTLAWVYFKIGLNEEATRVLTKALSKAPDHGLLNYHLGMVTLKAGDRIMAKQYFEKAMNRSSESEDMETVRQVLADISS
ncbi:tetratricopeptide repeat protein [Candidatus Nitrospira allomarina]|uniref:Tetratricopeptide repeat protein n=1 Tax=Candidatus Nitrospira allomarina TaxID=3020900 RepID=A0AA96GBJ5_9BACT|nr:tetratricopeptide repeat protein [Candidatus Nitrospira allomarina]WNM57982.1 tetratricopeptide repeat protein [Candidatus Nitrospira allomarina]